MDDIRQIPSANEQVIVEGTVIATDDNSAATSRIDQSSDDDNLSPIAGEPIPVLPAVHPVEPPAVEAPVSTDPEFDAYMTVVRLLIGGSIEGAAELVKRLEKWEAELNATDGVPGPGEIHSNSDVARYMLVGMAFSASEGVRQQVFKLAQASDLFFRFTGSATQPLVNNRLTGIVARPIDRALDRLVNRGQKLVNDWVELGRAQEPGARRIARKTYTEVVDEFIDHLAENQELAELVQKKSIGLANEAVDEFRSRTVSADAMAENIVRRILRRPPRQELPRPSEDVQLVIMEGKSDSS
jgi:hypothetical protein